MIGVGLQGYETPTKNTRFVAEVGSPECRQVYMFFGTRGAGARHVDVTDLYKANQAQVEALVRHIQTELGHAHRMGREEVQNTIKEALGYDQDLQG